MFTYLDFKLCLQTATLDQFKAGRTFNTIRCEEILLEEKSSDFVEIQNHVNLTSELLRGRKGSFP